MRAFIGITVPFIRKYDELSDIIHGQFVKDFKMVESNNMHITMKFLGEISIQESRKLWDKLILPKESFNISGSGLKHFPTGAKKARVLFIPLLSWELERVVNENSIFSDEDKYLHCTLGRFKRPADTSSIEEKYRSEIFFDFRPQKICLFKSTLLSTGPVYEEIFSHQLM
ncbi:RNA 2',3'-cyclic phosphodiesterase [Cuniculiplasma sp. SKW3]|uniref:RNA 2',3'-cyclic phosphodiesterase n=1 Tax=Cuniculiplasma sp. SKW3 TaxID=3400170 RepID=UPI003FD302A0